MKEIQIKKIKKLSKTRRQLYVRSSANLAHLDNQLGSFIPVLSETIAEIKKKQQRQMTEFRIKGVSQFFDYLTEKDKKEEAINILEYLLFCFDNGCKSVKKVIRKELLPLIKEIEHLIDFELKKVIKPFSFSLLGFLKA